MPSSTETREASANNVVVTADAIREIESAAVEQIEELKRQLMLASQEKTNLKEKLTQREVELKASQEQVQSLESEMQKQVAECSRMENDMETADTRIKDLLSEAEKVEGMKAKIAEYESLKTELAAARQALAEQTANTSETKAVEQDQSSTKLVTENRSVLEHSLKEKDEMISLLRNELKNHQQAVSQPTVSEAGDFPALNAQLAKFSEEIEKARRELEDGKRRMAEV